MTNIKNETDNITSNITKILAKKLTNFDEMANFLERQITKHCLNKQKKISITLSLSLLSSC